MSDIVNLSALIAKRRLDLDLEEQTPKNKSAYSSDWQYVKRQVNLLPKDIGQELLKDVQNIKEHNVGRSIKYSRELTPIFHNNKKYGVEIIIYERDRVVTRAYYICYNNYENTNFIRVIIDDK